MLHHNLANKSESHIRLQTIRALKNMKSGWIISDKFYTYTNNYDQCICIFNNKTYILNINDLHVPMSCIYDLSSEKNINCYQAIAEIIIEHINSVKTLLNTIVIASSKKHLSTNKNRNLGLVLVRTEVFKNFFPNDDGLNILYADTINEHL